MRYYTYKITFEDLPGYFYYGKHKHKNDLGKYLGTPQTWKHLWKQFVPQVQILQWYETWEEASEAEESILRATWDSPYSLNENIGGVISVEICRENGRRWGKVNGPTNGETSYRMGIGIHSQTPEEKRELSILGAQKVSEEKRGVHSEKYLESDKRKETLKKAGEVVVREKLGFHNPEYINSDKYREDKKKAARAVNSRRSQCLVTGYVSSPAGLTMYQKNRNIDTTLRKEL